MPISPQELRALDMGQYNFEEIFKSIDDVLLSNGAVATHRIELPMQIPSHIAAVIAEKYSSVGWRVSYTTAAGNDSSQCIFVLSEPVKSSTSYFTR